MPIHVIPGWSNRIFLFFSFLSAFTSLQILRYDCFILIWTFCNQQLILVCGFFCFSPIRFLTLGLKSNILIATNSQLKRPVCPNFLILIGLFAFVSTCVCNALIWHFDGLLEVLSCYQKLAIFVVQIGHIIVTDTHSFEIEVFLVHKACLSEVHDGNDVLRSWPLHESILRKVSIFD